MSRAKMIMEHLGGSKFLAMTGVKNYLYSDLEPTPNISFRLPRNGKQKINHVRIKLVNDFYTIEFGNISSAKRLYEYTQIKVCENISVGQLREVFTNMTGYETSL